MAFFTTQKTEDDLEASATPSSIKSSVNDLIDKLSIDSRTAKFRSREIVYTCGKVRGLASSYIWNVTSDEFICCYWTCTLGKKLTHVVANDVRIA